MKNLTLEELLKLDPEEFDGKVLTQEEVLHWFKLLDAAWIHDGDPTKPHAELISGMCSDAFFECQKALERPKINKTLARQLAPLIMKSGIKKTDVDWVIGSPYADITFSYEIADIFDAVHGFPEKDPTDPKGKRLVWRRRTIPAGSNVLQVEELTTTSKTFKKVRRAVIEGNSEPVNFLSTIGVLIHRPPELPIEYEIDGTKIKIVALVEKRVWAADPSQCLLCKAGSKRYRPKENWEKLTGKQ